jgi:hypothetical protein
MPEVWQIIQSGVVQEGKVDDVSRLIRLETRKPRGGSRRGAEEKIRWRTARVLELAVHDHLEPSRVEG